jgi:hypothetical protein
VCTKRQAGRCEPQRGYPTTGLAVLAEGHDVTRLTTEGRAFRLAGTQAVFNLEFDSGISN